jgi:hypothetical protein
VGTAKPSASMALEHLSISHNGICDVSPELLRPFVVALFCPATLLTLNDVAITDEERVRARSIYGNIMYSVIPTGICNAQHGAAQAKERGGSKKDGEPAAVNCVPIAVSSKKGAKNASAPGSTNMQNILLSASNAIAARRTKMLFEAQFNSSMHDVIKQTVLEMQEYDYD